MKCENCGKNEVTFVYQSNINGHVEEKHLCSECAEKLGYTQRINAHSQRMMQNFFGRGSLFGSSFAAPARQQETKKEEDLVEKEEQSRFSYLRQLNALKVEMKKAVHQENFERAAELRDQIHKLEADHKEQKSGE